VRVLAMHGPLGRGAASGGVRALSSGVGALSGGCGNRQQSGGGLKRAGDGDPTGTSATAGVGGSVDGSGSGERESMGPQGSCKKQRLLCTAVAAVAAAAGSNGGGSSGGVCPAASALTALQGNGAAHASNGTSDACVGGGRGVGEGVGEERGMCGQGGVLLTTMDQQHDVLPAQQQQGTCRAAAMAAKVPVAPPATAGGATAGGVAEASAPAAAGSGQLQAGVLRAEGHCRYMPSAVAGLCKLQKHVSLHSRADQQLQRQSSAGDAAAVGGSAVSAVGVEAWVQGLSGGQLAALQALLAAEAVRRAGH
jgi:hypothetical protein